MLIRFPGYFSRFILGCSSEFVSDLIELSSRDKMKNNKKKLSEILQDNPRMMLDWEAAVVIKNITNTPIEIPEEMDVIDVRKAVEDMLKESREEGIEIGEIQMLVKLVKEGDLKIECAAVKAKMTVDQFQKMMETAPA